MTDFDLAWFPAATSHTVEAFGAPFYAAPEQLTDPGKSVAHQPAVDVYALAMLGTFLLTGRDPVSKDEAFSAVEVASRRWHSRTAASLLLDTLRRAGDRDPAKRIRLDEMRDALIEVSDSLIAAANPNAALGPADFFAQLGALLGYSGREATDSGPRAITYSSASERTGIDVVLVDGGFDVVFRKIDSFLAEGTSTTQARHALVRRVDGRMDTIKRLAPAGVGVQRRGGSGGVHVRVEFRNAELSPTVATFAARAIAVIVSICETF